METMRQSRQEDMPRLRQLWQAVFGDGPAFLDIFFRLCGTMEDILVLEENGQVATMLALLPTTLVDAGGRALPLPYLYALATDPVCRGKGYARRLLACADEVAGKRGAAGICTVPAQPSLHAFFASAGYEEGLFTRVRKAPAPGLFGKWEPVEPEQYNALRRKLLAGSVHVDYPDHLIALQKEISRLSGAELYRLSGPRFGCAAVERSGEDMTVKELLLPEGALGQVGGKRQAGRWEIRSPVSSQTPAEEVCPFGMLRWLTEDHPAVERGYLGLAFD